MSTEKKPRADARLKTLPVGRQSAIAEYLVAHTLAETVAWLRADGLATSPASLSEFLAWYSARQKIAQREQKIQAWLECEKLEHPELTDEDLFTRGQRKFSILSIAEEDAEAWSKIQATAMGKEKIELQRQAEQRMRLALKVDMDSRLNAACAKLLEAATRAKADEINASSLSQAEKIKAMRQEYFKDVDELMASGKVVLPD